MPKHRAIAPVIDLACLAAFVAVGGRRHDDLNEGFGWFLEVLWPIALGWAVLALVTGLYTRTGAGMWAALLVTLFGGIVITQVIRYIGAGPSVDRHLHRGRDRVHRPHDVRMAGHRAARAPDDPPRPDDLTV